MYGVGPGSRQGKPRSARNRLRLARCSGARSALEVHSDRIAAPFVGVQPQVEQGSSGESWRTRPAACVRMGRPAVKDSSSRTAGLPRNLPSVTRHGDGSKRVGSGRLRSPKSRPACPGEAVTGYVRTADGGYRRPNVALGRSRAPEFAGTADRMTSGTGRRSPMVLGLRRGLQDDRMDDCLSQAIPPRLLLAPGHRPISWSDLVVRRRRHIAVSGVLRRHRPSA